MINIMQGHTRAQEHKSARAGAVLIIALWILSMLVLLAISIGRRTSIELRLLKYHISRSQAFHLARAAIERISAEKNIDDNKYDSLNESWSNKSKADGEPLFKDFPLGNGTFTIKYSQAEAEFYGMQDESSKLNINKILTDDKKIDENRKKEFQNLINRALADSKAETMVNNFADWIDNMDDDRETFSNGEIKAKNAPLDRLEELTMIDGFSVEDVNTLSGYITIYGDGAVNINTAPKEALSSLCCDKDGKPLGDETAEKIITYRSGENGEIKPIESIALLSTSEIISEEEKKILDSRAVVQSSYYSVNSQAEVSGVKKEISAVINFNQDTEASYLYWYED